MLGDRRAAMILVVTETLDPHADHVTQMLTARGAEWLRFNPADFPVQASLSLGYAPNGQMQSCLRLGEKVIDLTQLQSVWTRRPQVPVPHEHIQDAATRAFVAEECKTFVRDVWNALPCRWLPGHPDAIH